MFTNLQVFFEKPDFRRRKLQQNHNPNGPAMALLMLVQGVGFEPLTSGDVTSFPFL
jgi:hypothetical protein